MRTFDPWLNIAKAQRDPKDRTLITATCAVREGFQIESAEVVFDGMAITCVFRVPEDYEAPHAGD